MYTQQSIASSTSHGSTTKGFMSFSSQSVIENSKGPTFFERLKSNSYFLAINLQRYKGFSSAWISFASIFRLIQNYAVILMPGYTDFWKSDQHSSIFINILTLPIHLCFVPGDTTFHGIMAIVFSIIMSFVMIITIYYLAQDPKSHSYTNTEIFFISFLYGIIVPIFTTFGLSCFGTLLKHLVFFSYRTAILYVGIFFSVITLALVIPLNILSFAFVRARNAIDMSTVFATWSSMTWLYFFLDICFAFCAFFEEFLPLNQDMYMIIFCVILFIFNNPFSIYGCFNFSVFQDFNDSIYFAIQNCSTMLAIVLMILTHYVDGLTPAIVFIVTIVCFALFLFIFRLIAEAYSNSVIKKLTSVYKYSRSVLPPTTPLVFTQPESLNVGLTQDAYNVMQAFDSLNIKSSHEFHKYVSIATNAKLPAVTNLDLIKWGLYHFHDYNTLVDSAQICLHFGDVNQVLSVIIQHIRENGEPPLFMSFAINIIESLHIDQISAQPELFKMLEKKAEAGLTRCRRTTALFWGCVLNHSYLSMKEALCRMRDAISSTNAHFDELTRCYPYSKSTIILHLSFLTEVQGFYMKTNQYINDLSSHLIELKAEQTTIDDDSLDLLGDILNDNKQTFHHYTNDLSSFMEQERLANSTSQAPMIALWTLASVSLLVIIGCLLFVICETLITFNTYPRLLDIITSCTQVIMNLASLSIGARRMCLFSKNEINTGTKLIPFGNMITDASVYDNASVLLPHFISEAETLTQTLQNFFTQTAYSDRMLQTLEGHKANFILYGYNFYGSLSFALDLMTNAIRNVAGNVPSLYTDQTLKNPFTLSTMQMMGVDGPNVEINPDAVHKQRELFFNTLNSKMKKNPLGKIDFHMDAKDSQNKGTSSEESTQDASEKDHKRHGHGIIVDHVNKTILYDPVELYETTCQSSEIKHVILNIEASNTLVVQFFNDFLDLARDSVDDLGTLLQYAMIILPIAFMVLFCSLVAIVSYFVVKESNFRTTLYLSLPEQVASEIFRAGGVSGTYFKNNHKKHQSEEVCEVPTLYGSKQRQQSQPSQFTLTGNEDDGNQLKEKARTIESLHQFSVNERGIQGTGIKQFVAWSIIYIIVGALGMFALTFYASDINDSFYARSELICESALRFLRVLYSTLFTAEYFYQDNEIKLLEPDEIYKIASGLIDRADNSHKLLTFGNDDIPYDFREYQHIKELIIKELGATRANIPSEALQSYATIQHDGYKQFGLDTKFRVFQNFLRGLNDNFFKDISSYKRNEQVWEQFDHMFFGHLMSEVQSTINSYSEGVSDVIGNSFMTALIISIVLLIVLVLIFVLPLRSSLVALGNYFDLTLHTICMIPKDVFSRSIYITKWIKGEISFKNFHQYETNFKRTVSAHIQTQILEESTEKLLVFNSDLEFIPIGEMQVPEDQSLQSLLSIYVDLDKSPRIQENVEKAFSRYQEAKDSIDPINYKAFSSQGNPIRVTIRGIPTSEVAESANMTKFYAYIAVLFRDITSETSEFEAYKKQKEKTISLIAQSVPMNFAKRLHDAERRITFSAGIGSVTTCELCNYWKVVSTIEPTVLAKVIYEIRIKIDELLKEFTNISFITMDDGVITFVAGLFNDEQNGRTEAIDSLQFSIKFYQQLKEILQQNNVNMPPKFAISTGGPIYCKLFMDSSPIIMISDDTANLSAAIVKNAKPDQLLLERTSYECIWGINIDASMVGDFDAFGKHTSLYSVNLQSASQQITAAPV